MPHDSSDTRYNAQAVAVSSSESFIDVHLARKWKIDLELAMGQSRVPVSAASKSAKGNYDNEESSSPCAGWDLRKFGFMMPSVKEEESALLPGNQKAKDVALSQNKWVKINIRFVIRGLIVLFLGAAITGLWATQTNSAWMYGSINTNSILKASSETTGTATAGVRPQILKAGAAVPTTLPNYTPKPISLFDLAVIEDGNERDKWEYGK